MSIPKQFIALSLFIVLVGVCGITLLRGGKRERWTSSPTQLRFGSDYDTVMKPDAPLQTNWPPITNITITTNIGGRVEMLHPEAQVTRRSNYGVERELMVPGKKVSMGKGFFSLDTIQVAYAQVPWNKVNEYAVDTPWRVFTPDLKELSAEEVKKKFPNAWERKGDYRGVYPEVKWTFNVEGTEVPKQLNFWSYDGRTHASLSNGRSSSYTKDSFYFATELPMWHQGPVEVVMDLAYEPGRPVKIPFQVGNSYVSSTVSLYLAGIFPGRSQSWGSNSDGKTNKINITYVRDTNHVTTSVVLLASPVASPIPVDIKFEGKNGKSIDNRGGSSSGGLLMNSFDGEPEDCQYIVITPYQKVKRIILQCPEIPGLPEANRNTENLFTVQIPHLRLRSEWELQNALERTVQLKMVYSSINSSPKVPMGKFPIMLTNATPGDLVRIYQSFLPPNVDMDVRPETSQMEWSDGDPWTKFKKFVHRTFSSRETWPNPATKP